ncbi:MAG: aminopeptidase [Brockia lithotrophica]|nr:aminopeptidase [Brockia lithotrophica]
MAPNEELLRAYARLAVRKGVNLQSGQVLVLNAPVEARDFVSYLVEEAYRSGARYVLVNYGDDRVTRLRYLLADDEALDYFPRWMGEGYAQMAREGAAFLSIYAPDPDLLADIPASRVARGDKARREAFRGYYAYTMSDRARWSLISVPTPAWARKVFPDLSEGEAVEVLWDAVLGISRVRPGDPLENWDLHRRNLERRVAYLNAKRYRKLHFRGEGTDLVVGLPEGHIWHGGGATDHAGIPFQPNIPTEEVYTMPHRLEVEGYVRNTKPLNVHGTLVDGFTLWFEGGRVVRFTAERGEETLRHLLDTDEGARHLGEVALVPVDSPVAQSGLLFYNTLYDENASCHLALGQAYPTTLQGGPDLSEDELRARGANRSLIHEDFMIGSPTLDVDGILPDGTREPLLRRGLWAFEV